MNANLKPGEIDAAIDTDARIGDAFDDALVTVGGEFLDAGTAPASEPPSPRSLGEGEGEGQRGDAGVRPPHPLPGLLPAGGEKEPVADGVALPELDQHAEMHRRSVAEFGARAAEARREGRAEIERIRADRKAMRERHGRELELLKREQAEELAVLDVQEAEAKADTEERVTTNRKLAAAGRAALAVIEGE